MNTMEVIHTQKKIRKPMFNLKTLRISLKYRPEILKLILKMRQCIRNKNSILLKLKCRLKEMESVLTNNDELKQNITLNTNDINSRAEKCDKIITKPKTENKTSQTDFNEVNEIKPNAKVANLQVENSGWEINKDSETKSIAEQVKEAAQDAMKESGMVYVESAGMYYDYKTGYYYNSELGLYYHTDTECYYYYSDEKQSFVFHSYPDRSISNAEAALLAHKKRKAKKHKLGGEENTSDENKPMLKKSKNEIEESNTSKVPSEKEDDDIFQESKEQNSEISSDNKDIEKDIETNKDEENQKEIEDTKSAELEEGECSDTSSDEEDFSCDKVDSTTTNSDDETIAKHHPPCMRVIVRETTIPKLRVGTLFLITKDGGTVGREGEHHTILLKDTNVSRNHMIIKYDSHRKAYIAIDLGSRNGSILNGSRMSESQITSDPIEIVHGSTLQLGETKLLCHIHSGNDTCGHCEPGLLMEDVEKEKKVAYTRTCSVKKQHELELARLKNKYGQKPMLAIEDTPYNDRAQARRDAVGSTHSSEKTQTSDIATSIAADNKGFKLLEKMGWNKGEGLGKDNQGDIEPVPLISNEGKTGLGAIPTPNNPANKLGPATMRLANRTKMLKPPAKAFQGILDEDSE